MKSEPYKGAGVRAVLRELRGQRKHGDTIGGTITALERAMQHKYVAFLDGQFVLTEAGRAYIDACGKEPWISQ